MEIYILLKTFKEMNELASLGKYKLHSSTNIGYIMELKTEFQKIKKPTTNTKQIKKGEK